MSRIFISYARENLSFVEAIYKPLQRVYQNIWYDKADRGLTPGSDWWDSIVNEISDCDILIIVQSEYWNDSEYGRKEYEEAFKRRKKILPIKIDNSMTPEFLAQIHYVEIQSEILDINSLSEVHAGVVKLTDEIAGAQKSFTSNLMKMAVGFGSIALILILFVIAIVATQFPAFSGEISYISRADGANFEVHSLDGGLQGLLRNMFNPGPRLLPYGMVSEDSKFEISPDGNYIAFAWSQRIYIADRDGSNITPLTGENDGDNRHPSWSPDGSQLIFSSNRSGTWEIFIIDKDGENLVALNGAPGAERNDYPDWSSTGGYIAFMSYVDGDWDIYRMNTDGTDIRNLTSDSNGDDRYPDWSPDGQHIVFASNRTASSAFEDFGLGDDTADVCVSDSSDIYIMNADGDEPYSIIKGSADDLYPTWSPDGQRIIFSSDRQGDYDLYFIPAERTLSDEPVPIMLTANETGNNYFPIWRS